MRFDNLAAWLTWQESLHVREIELGLDRCLGIAQHLGLLTPGYRVITVGGTNGKGSSVSMLSEILQAEGYRVGTYTSPHLLRYNERIRINGAAASDADLCAAFQRVDQARGDTSITYFEFGTLAAFSIFQDAGLDVAVLEVGLGGRLDAVNCVDADVALLAAIDIDHVEWLGPDRHSIAREKAGIFRPQRPAVCSDPDAPSTLLEEAARVGCQLHLLGRDFKYDVDLSGSWSWVGPCGSYSNLPRPRLIGEYQYQNASGVLMALQCLSTILPVGEEAICQGLDRVELAGRFTLIPGPVEIILDVAHNPQAAAVLAGNLRARPVSGGTHAIVGMLKDKDRIGVFTELVPVIDHWHTVTLPGPRGATSDQLAAELGGIAGAASISNYPDVPSALVGARSCTAAGDRILIAGSFLTVSAAMRILQQ